MPPMATRNIQDTANDTWSGLSLVKGKISMVSGNRNATAAKTPIAKLAVSARSPRPMNHRPILSG